MILKVTIPAATLRLPELFAERAARISKAAEGRMASAWRAVAQVYLTDQRRRFTAQSKGGGEWPDLAPSTKKGRATGTKAGRERLAKKVNAAIKEKLPGLKIRSLRRLQQFLVGKKGKERRLIRRAVAKAQAIEIKALKGRSSRASIRNSLIAQGHYDILKDSDRLFLSLTTGAPDNITVPLHNGIMAGTNVHYAHHHQDGGSIPGHPPQRKILVDPSKEMIKHGGEILGKSIAMILKGAA